MYRVLQGLHENALVGHLIKTYDWDEFEQICNSHPTLMKSVLKNTNTPLHEICNIGSAPHHLLKRVVDCWPEATIARNRYGETPLHVKCRCSQYSLYPVKLLLETNQTSVRMLNGTGKAPLAIACLSGASVSVVKELVNAYPEALSIKDINDHTPIDLLWSSFAKTIPGASAISNYLKRGHDENIEMSGLLARFFEKMSFCLNRSKSLSSNADQAQDESTFELLLHTIIEANLHHCPHTLLDVYLTYDRDFGLQLDENGNTSLHIQILKGFDQKCLHVLLTKCKESASIVDSGGRLPLHLALKKQTNEKSSSFEKTVLEIMKANTEALDVKDPESSFYPFMAAAVINELNLTFQFLLSSPNVVLDIIKAEN